MKRIKTVRPYESNKLELCKERNPGPTTESMSFFFVYH